MHVFYAVMVLKTSLHESKSLHFSFENSQGEQT